MRKKCDLTGRRFGKIVVIHRAGHRTQPSGAIRELWKCRCDCGQEKEMPGAGLLSGKAQSCGCARRGKERLRKDLTGQRFSSLLVLGRAPTRRTPQGHPRVMWLCQCDCGQQKEIAAGSLSNKTTKSCGHPHRGKESHQWRGGRSRWAQGYIRLYLPEIPGKGKDPRYRVFEHVLVMEQKLGRSLLPGETVHHKNGIRDDNRIENLELWATKHGSGQRVEDLVAWAEEILSRYKPSIISPCCI